MYICSVYKEFPRYNLSREIKDHKFWRFKTLLYNHHSLKPGHIPDESILVILYDHATSIDFLSDHISMKCFCLESTSGNAQHMK